MIIIINGIIIIISIDNDDTRKAQVMFSVAILLNTILIGVEADTHESGEFSWSDQEYITWFGV